jgi:hypothetical protein
MAFGVISVTMPIVFGVVGPVLVIAGTNIDNLMSGPPRVREMAIRVAASASRARLIRPLLTESTLVSPAGAVVGTVLRAILQPDARALLSFTRLPDRGPRIRVFAFSFLLSLAIAALFGLAPGSPEWGWCRELRSR